MKKIIASFGLLAVIFTLGAQNNQEAKQLMEKVSKKLQSYQSIQADFSFTLSNPGQNIKDTYDGTLLLSGDQYKLALMGIIAYCNGKALWTVNPELKETTILDPEENELFNPKSIFRLYEEEYRYQMVSDSGDRAVMDLFPLDQEETYTKIRLTLLKSKEQIERVTYYSTDGNQYEVVIKKMTTDAPVPQKSFSYDPTNYPGFKVYDMR